MRRLRWRAALSSTRRAPSVCDHRQYQPLLSELVRGVERSCFERGYSLVLCNTEGDEQRMNRNLETLMQKRVDGLLLLCTETHQPSKEIIQRYPSIPP